MRKIWGNVIRYVLRNKRKSLLIIVCLVIAFFIVAKNNKIAANPQVKGSNKISEAQLQKLIKENTEKYQPKKNWLAENPQELPTSATASVILDYDSNELLFADNEHEKLFPASITKVLTATIALETMDTNKVCTITENAANMEPNKISMKAGEEMRLEDLIYGMMMISANDAAEAIADCYPDGRQAFIDKMNQKVRELGLTDTTFVNPSGWHDDNHKTSAFDMATITNYALKSNPEFLKYFGRTESYSVYPTEKNESHWWNQISTLLKTYPGMDGAKTGFTYEAGNTYIGTAKSDGHRIIIVYFNANSSTYDAKLLLDQGLYLSSIKNGN